MIPGLLDDGGDRVALRVAGQEVRYRDLAATAAALAAEFGAARRVAVWATPELSTCLAVVAAVTAGVPAIPVNPRSGAAELAHIVADSAPDVVAAAPDAELPAALAGVRRVDVRPVTAGGRGTVGGEHDPEAPALIVYTSGTTGPPKGVVLPRRAVTSNLDALAAAWEWTGRDVLVHGLPLFHVHGLVLGVLGPLRLGGTLHHLGRFTPDGAAAALAGDATMLFGVPTMYHRLVAEAERSPDVADALRRARLLVSGSAALPASDHQRIAAATGQRVVERYGMTETLMNCAVRASGDRRPGHVGPPVDGVELRLVSDPGDEASGGEADMISFDGRGRHPGLTAAVGRGASAGPAAAVAVEVPADGETIGEIHVRGPNLFLEYLNRPDATAASMRDGWFATGDVATMGPDGYVRIVGRKATDLIKSGGFKIGAGEIENTLLGHPAVAEVAVTGEPDPDLGERVVAWVVPTPGATPSTQELADHVATELAPHKRPRTVRFLTALPRNDLGKVTKNRLGIITE